jgi:F-box-like
MSVPLDIDHRIVVYTTKNDPLPAKFHPLLAAHLDSLRSHITDLDAAIVNLEEKLAQREGELEELRIQLAQQIEAKDRHVASCRVLESTTSVIRRLPPEIIAMIFTSIPNESWTGTSARDLCRACAVSMFWRRTALSTPTLWRRFKIMLCNFSDATVTSPEEARLLFSNTLDMWFSRAGEGADVDLWLNQGNGLKYLVGRHIINWIVASRFKLASLKLDWIPLQHPDLRSLLLTNCPSLHTTRTLSFLLPSLSISTPTIIDGGSTLPRLRDLAISAQSGVNTLPMHLAHPCLSKLKLEDLALRHHELPILLHGLPSLQQLELVYCAADENEPAPPEFLRFTHHSINTLILYECLTLADFFDGLSCPILDKVKIDSGRFLDESTSREENIDINDACAFGRFLKRSQPSHLVLQLGAQLPPTFLNGIFNTSGSTIKALELESSVSLPLDVEEPEVRLFIPSSIRSIHNFEEMSDEEAASWNHELSLSFEDGQNEALSITFGRATERSGE